MGAWLDYISGIAIGVVALLLLFEGCRRSVLHGFRKTSVLALVGGLAISSATGGLAYMQHRMSHDAIETLKRPVISKHLPLPDDWGAACCKDTREEQSRKMVEAAFLESGQIHSYMDSSGKRIPYAPSEKDIKQREERAIADARLEDASRARLSEAVYTLIAALLALVFGMAMGYEQRKASANSTVESDARKGSARGSP
jgi:hypothetical protein